MGTQPLRNKTPLRHLHCHARRLHSAFENGLPMPFPLPEHTPTISYRFMNAVLVPLFFSAITVAIVFVLSKNVFPYRQSAMLHKRLMHTGTEADATILAVSQTGLSLNNRPLLRLEVHVHPAGAHSFVAEVRQEMDFVQIPHFQKGNSVRVKYNPGNPKQVVLA